MRCAVFLELQQMREQRPFSPCVQMLPYIGINMRHEFARRESGVGDHGRSDFALPLETMVNKPVDELAWLVDPIAGHVDADARREEGWLWLGTWSENDAKVPPFDAVGLSLREIWDSVGVPEQR